MSKKNTNSNTNTNTNTNQSRKRQRDDDIIIRHTIIDDDDSVIVHDEDGNENNHNDTDEEDTIDEEREEEESENAISVFEQTSKKIDTLQDLIDLARLYEPFIGKPKRPRWNLNLERLYRMLPSLLKLNGMIGMLSVKKTIVNLIVYYLQDFETACCKHAIKQPPCGCETTTTNMLHTVIEGPPGTGKTEVAKIIAELYLCLGVLQNKTFRIVRRSDLIGGYLGQTAIKTQKVIDEVKGGVLFIDEAYSLGNPEGRDSYSKECIDTINLNLTENKGNFICIIAGYPDSLKESFFSVNRGLERRFPFRFKIEEYNSNELRSIFLKIVNENNWYIENSNEEIDVVIPISFFERNKQYFLFNGGDMENLFQLVKIAHSKRVYCLNRSLKKRINYEDLQNAFELYLENSNVKNRNEISRTPPMMYL